MVQTFNYRTRAISFICNHSNWNGLADYLLMDVVDFVQENEAAFKEGLYLYAISDGNLQLSTEPVSDNESILIISAGNTAQALARLESIKKEITLEPYSV